MDTSHMDINTIRWTYAIAKPGPAKELDVAYSDGPISQERIREIVGGDYGIEELMDRTAFAYCRREQFEQGEPNHHYPGVRGTVLVGKLSNGIFVGAIGVQL